MCLYTKQKEPLIAEKPIKAFKVLIHNFEDKFLSPFQDFDYTEYVNSHCIIKDITSKVEYPNHNFVIVCSDLGAVKINRGLRLFIDKNIAIEIAKSYTAGVVFECDIPVGSYYFLNDGETEICTNQFRFIKEI